MNVMLKRFEDPGWCWSEHVGRDSGMSMCPVEHVGMVVSGRATAEMADGTIYETSVTNSAVAIGMAHRG